MEDMLSIKSRIEYVVKMCLCNEMERIHKRNSDSFKIWMLLKVIIFSFIIYLSFAENGIYPVDIYNFFISKGFSNIPELASYQNLMNAFCIIKTFIIVSIWSVLFKCSMVKTQTHNGSMTYTYINIACSVLIVVLNLLGLGTTGVLYEIALFTLIYISSINSVSMVKMQYQAQYYEDFLRTFKASEDDVKRFKESKTFKNDFLEINFEKVKDKIQL